MKKERLFERGAPFFFNLLRIITRPLGGKLGLLNLAIDRVIIKEG